MVRMVIGAAFEFPLDVGLYFVSWGHFEAVSNSACMDELMTDI